MWLTGVDPKRARQGTRILLLVVGALGATAHGGCNLVLPYAGRAGPDGATHDHSVDQPVDRPASAKDLIVDPGRPGEGPFADQARADAKPGDVTQASDFTPADLGSPDLPSGVTIRRPSGTTLQPGDTGNLSDHWDLTKCGSKGLSCDLELRFTVDLTGAVSAAQSGSPLYAEVGLRDSTGGNFNPNGHGGWLVSHLHKLDDDATMFDLNDKLLVQNTGGAGEKSYDVHDCTNPAITTTVNVFSSFGIWYDRGDATNQPAANDGKIYNTGGIYHVRLCFHALSASTGAVCAQINGAGQGLYTGSSGWPPDIYPAGLGFTGKMSDMQVFYGTCCGQGSVTLSNFEITGCLK